MDATPLTTPEGVIAAYMCGECGFVATGDVLRTAAGPLAPAVRAHNAELARQNATLCCQCRTCKQYVGVTRARTEHFCVTCQVKADEEQGLLMVLYVQQAAMAEAAYNASMNKALDRAAAESLEQEMSIISEDRWAAGWLSGLEYVLWEEITGPAVATGLSYDAHRLLCLAEKCGGWIAHRRFVPMAEWQAQYAARNAHAKK